MSISNGKQKRNNKKNSTLSTAAVYPIIQSVPKEEIIENAITSAPVSPFNETEAVVSHKSSTKKSIKVSFGQCVEPQTVIEPSLVSSVADLMHEVIPQGQTPLSTQNEVIHWVDVKKLEYAKANVPQIGFVIIIGLARGYQIWWMEENGNCLEVVSERKGPLKVGQILPFIVDVPQDKFQDSRPLFARVDGNPLMPENKLCTVNILSLATGEEVHELSFKDPVLDISSSAKCFIVALYDTIILCNPGTFEECLTIPVSASNDPNTYSPYDLSDGFLAYSDKTLNKHIQSVGGVVLGEDSSYSGQLMNAAKSFSKTVTSISESVFTSFTTGNQNKQTNSTTELGIVTVIDAGGIVKGERKVQGNKHVISHFVAHESALGYLAFGNGGQLLLTASQSGTSFYVFNIHPHSGLSALGSVQHLYTLYRGNSAAKVVNCAFSDDNRWVAVSTNHGTTHLFAISPYGGAISMRTHGDKLVNKESRFERTAGLTSDHVTRNINHHAPVKPGQAVFGSSGYYKEHPSISQSSLFKTVINPRLNLNTVPIALYSVAKIRARVFSAESLSAWASDNTPVSISSSKSNGRSNGQNCATESNRRLSAAFTSHLNESLQIEGPILCVMNVDGVLTSYQIKNKNERHNSSSSNSSMNIGEILSSSPNSSNTALSTKLNVHESPIRVRSTPTSQWFLHRSRNAASVEPPLSKRNALIVYSNRKTMKQLNCNKQIPDYWLQHVEVETYSGPHRRLWMGPQFTFGHYAASGHASAQLFNPNDSHSATMYTTAQKCCPVLIEKNSAYSGISNDFSNDSSRIVCGSWSSEFDMKGMIDPGVKEKIEDAMRDIEPFESSGTQADLLSLSGMDL